MTSPSLFQRGEPPKLAGAGPALTAKLAELCETGRLEYHERLRAQVPDGLLEILRIPGVGPKTVRLLHIELGIDSRRGAAGGRGGGPAAPREGPLGAHRDRTSSTASAGSSAAGPPLLLHDADDLVAASSSGCATPAACVASRSPGRCGGGGRRSAISTCWPRSTTRQR